MKIRYIYYVRALFFLTPIIAEVTLSGCSIFDEPRELPPITKTGEWNFGCLVNGQLVRINNSMLMRGEVRDDIFILSFSRTVDDKLHSESLMGFEFRMIEPLEIGVKYDLTDSNDYNVEYIEYVNGLPNCTYAPGHTQIGHLTFSNIDRSKYIISGNFEFETATDKCDNIKATEGRFDIHYQPH